MKTTADIATSAADPDGTTTEYLDVRVAEDTLVPLVLALFEDHWQVIT